MGNDSLVYEVSVPGKTCKEASPLSFLHLLKLGNQLSFDFWAFCLHAFRAIAFEVN